MSVLPKKRGAVKQTGRGSSTILHDLSTKGRVLSERVLSGTKRKPLGTRHVSRGDMFVARGDGDANSSFAEDAIHFHENKLTIMLNFEEWIKLSTDNKITSKNSWHFALIDYFHDLNVIKDGDNINFQRALATLDGCVKIYLSRVESAASETGKLLSGLATKRGQMVFEEAHSEDENGDPEDETDPSSSGKKERKINRIVELTLVPFDAIQIKKLDQELAIDPLFKKALADFDEGGAKSLLLNTLNIDSSGRVVFDATTNPITSSHDAQPQKSGGTNDRILDFSPLLRFLYEDPVDLGSCVISSSMDLLKTVMGDVNKARSILTDVNSKFFAEEEEERKNAEAGDTQSFPDFDIGLDFDDQDSPDADLAKIEEELRNQQPSFGAESEEQSLDNGDQIVAKETVLDLDLMAYFDERLKTNWRGPEHWRVTALKQSKTVGPATADGASTNTGTSNLAEVPKKPRKEPVLIDFYAEDDDDVIEDMFRKSKNQFAISKRPEDRRSEHSYILPEDIQFNSQKLVTLFLKPNKTIVTFSKLAKVAGGETGPELSTYTDEQYFANRYEEREKHIAEEERQEKLALSFHQAEMEDCDNENYRGIDFNDVLEGDDGPLQEDLGGEIKDDFGNQLVTGGHKARPEYVNFSRVAKRVDIKLLKDNLWKAIKIEEDANGAENQGLNLSETPESNQEEGERKKGDHAGKQKSFKEVMDVIGTMYRVEEKKDLSTSFCFICLLHLANEHGLLIESTELHDNLVISGF